MSSVLSCWFYFLTLGISCLLLIALILIYYNPDSFLQLTSKSGQLVDLTDVNNFDPTNIPGTAEFAIIKIGSNSYSIANNTVSSISNAFVAPAPSPGKSAADDVAGAQITGTFMFWLLLLSIGFLTLLFAFIGIKYPEKLFGPQVSALIKSLPKTSCSYSSSSKKSSSISTGSGCKMGCGIPLSTVTSAPKITTPSTIPTIIPSSSQQASSTTTQTTSPTTTKAPTPTASSSTASVTAASLNLTPAQAALIQLILAGKVPTT